MIEMREENAKENEEGQQTSIRERMRTITYLDTKTGLAREVKPSTRPWSQTQEQGAGTGAVDEK